jgi:telomere length regulation protein
MDSTQEGLETVVRTLASQPSEEQLVQVLRRFQPASSSPTSPVASVIFAIVNTTLPELWRSLQVNTNSNEAVLLVIECLSSVAGVNALLMRLDQLHNQRQQKSNVPLTMLMEDILEVLTRILEGKKFSPAKFIELCGQENTKAKLVFNEYLALVGGSKILNIVSKTAADLDNVSNLWIADGKRYSKWLGERLGIAIIKYSERPEIAGLIVKALSLGYPCIFLKESS